MKKILLQTIAIAMILTLTTGCGKEKAPVSPSSDVSIIINESSSENIPEESSKPTANPQSMPPVMDASYYRGIVKEITEDGKWIIAQGKGRDFGKEQFICDINETKFHTEKSNIELNDYVEFYYSNNSDSEEISPIIIGKLLAYKDCVVNGIVLSQDENKLTLAVDGNNDNLHTVVITEETNVYASEIKKDEYISVYFNGMKTRSTIPQIIAIEITNKLNFTE